MNDKRNLRYKLRLLILGCNVLFLLLLSYFNLVYVL